VTSWQPGVAPTKFAELVEQLAKLLDIVPRAAACFHVAGPPVCWCRKPLPGLGLVMAHHHRVRFELCIGAGAADKGFAARVGVPYHDVRDGWPLPGTMDA
jgi:histidinol phosphatase-like enzyme